MNKTISSSNVLQPTAENFNNAAAITPSDTVANIFDSIYVGGAGNITVDMAGGQSGVLFTAVPVGIFKIAVTKVYSAGTAATAMVGLKY